MMDVESYRQNAADCVRQAEGEAAPEDKNILLNVALAWVRLAHQVQEFGSKAKEAAESEALPAEAAADAPGVASDEAEPEPDKPLLTH